MIWKLPNDDTNLCYIVLVEILLGTVFGVNKMEVGFNGDWLGHVARGVSHPYIAQFNGFL